MFAGVKNIIHVVKETFKFLDFFLKTLQDLFHSNTSPQHLHHLDLSKNRIQPSFLHRGGSKLDYPTALKRVQSKVHRCRVPNCVISWGLLRCSIATKTVFSLSEMLDAELNAAGPPSKSISERYLCQPADLEYLECSSLIFAVVNKKFSPCSDDICNYRGPKHFKYKKNYHKILRCSLCIWSLEH